MTTATSKSVSDKDIAWTCHAIDREDTHILCCESCGDLEFAVTGDLETLKKLKRLWGGKIGFIERLSHSDPNREAQSEPERRWGYLGEAAEAVKTLSILSKSKHLADALQADIDDALDEWTVRNVRGGRSMFFVQP